MVKSTVDNFPDGGGLTDRRKAILQCEYSDRFQVVSKDSQYREQAESYRLSLPGRTNGAAWTIQSYGIYVNILYPEISVPSNQEWLGKLAIYEHICKRHGSYRATANNVASRHTGNQCRKCADEGRALAIKIKVDKARSQFEDKLTRKHDEKISLRDITQYIDNKSPLGVVCNICHHEWSPRPSNLLSGKGCPKCQYISIANTNTIRANDFVGIITVDGHLVLEHIGWVKKPSASGRGVALYRYECAVCGNKNAQARGHNLKTPGNTIHCGCLSTNDSCLTFAQQTNSQRKSAFFYVYECLQGKAFKIGITHNIQKRKTNSYEKKRFHSLWIARANVWAIEQVLLYFLRKAGLQYDLSLAKEFRGKEKGGSEVFIAFSLAPFLEVFDKLCDEVSEIGFSALIDRYIPIEDMDYWQLYRWEEGRAVQSKGAGYIGNPWDKVFASLASPQACI